MLTILLTLVIFGVIITTHEFGHFIVAKKCGVIVEEFSIGMGPLIFSIKGEDETLYSLRLLPLGGYCKMYGEDQDEEELGEGSLNSVTPFKRILILAAGALMNLTTALLLLIGIAGFVGTEPTTTINKVIDNSPAYEVGIKANDKIVKINDKEIYEWEDLQKSIGLSNGKTIVITIKRDDKLKEFSVKPSYDKSSDSYKIGINPVYNKSLSGAIKAGFTRFKYFSGIILGALKDLIRGAVGLSDLSGPIGVGKTIGQAMTYGPVVLLNIAALLAINIGIFNLLPIPALDGSRIFFCLIEIIRRKPIDREKEGLIHVIGLVLLLGVSVIVSIHDVITLF